MNALVSIIIPVYNAERYIAQTITSAINQTWPNKEIIIVDDGSADNSLAIAKTFENDHIQVLSQANKGASAARNKGLSLANGDYIQFLDADDLLSEDKITIQMEAIGSQDDFLAISRTIHLNADGYYLDPVTHAEQVTEYTSPVNFIANMYQGTADGYQPGMITVHSWLTPRKLIDMAGPWNEDLSVDDDGEFFCRVALKCHKIIYLPDAINFYRTGSGHQTLSSRMDEKAMQSIFLATQLKYQHLKKQSDMPIINKACARLFMDNAVKFYPRYKNLSAIAMAMVKQLGGTTFVPVLGGNILEFIKNILGWKTARWLSYYINKLKW